MNDSLVHTNDTLLQKSMASALSASNNTLPSNPMATYDTAQGPLHKGKNIDLSTQNILSLRLVELHKATQAKKLAIRTFRRLHECQGDDCRFEESAWTKLCSLEQDYSRAVASFNKHLDLCRRHGVAIDEDLLEV